MINVLNSLLLLQQTDNELAVLENKSKDMPRRIEGIRLVAENKKKELSDHQHNIVELKKECKLFEVDLKETEEKIGHYSSQLYAAKTNDQYKAFLKEIENVKKEKSSIEDKLLDALENIETTEKEIKHLETEFSEIEKETQEKIVILQREEENIQNAVNERVATRQNICEVIGKETLTIYERIRKNKGGLAVVKVDDVRCLGCLNPLPPQKLLEIQKNERIHFCEYCGRITVAQNNNTNNQ